MIKKISIGIIIAAVSFLVAHSMVGFPFEKPIIYYSLKTTEGSLVSTSEDVETSEQGAMRFYQYTFTYSADGKTFTRSIQRRGRLKPELRDISAPISVTILYSSIVPSFAQVAYDGEITFGDYVIRGILATLFAYGIATWLIILYFKNLKEESNKPTVGDGK